LGTAWEPKRFPASEPRGDGRHYGLHSLRHFVATQLYNQSKDWVQVAKFMGHRDPGITMKLYANHVVEAGQRELGALAAAPWWAD
jgi:integrase